MKKVILLLTIFMSINLIYSFEIKEKVPEGFKADSELPLLLGGDPMNPYFYYYGEIIKDGIKYTLCEQDGEIIYISTNDPNFTHKDGYQVWKNTYSEFKDYELFMTIDFDFYIILEDGWRLAFVPKDFQDPKLEGDETIRLFYKTAF